MSTQLDKIVSAELKAQKQLEKANLEYENIVDTAIVDATTKANEIKKQLSAKIVELEENKKAKLAELDEKLNNVVKIENEKIVKKVSAKVDDIAEKIYKEAIGND